MVEIAGYILYIIYLLPLARSQMVVVAGYILYI